jgi:P-type E1-E2 ATPase
MESGGIQARSSNISWRISPVKNGSDTFDQLVIGVWADQKLVATFELADLLRSDSSRAVEYFLKRNLKPIMLSGDQTRVTEKVADTLGILEVHSNQSPESKLAFVKSRPRAIMVGDGNNDAPSLQASFGSIAVMGSLDSSLKAADVYLTCAGLLPVTQLFSLAELTMKVIRTNLYFTVCYNLVGVSLALTGNISALFAAILMPLSSITVTFHSIYRMRRASS